MDLSHEKLYYSIPMIAAMFKDSTNLHTLRLGNNEFNKQDIQAVAGVVASSSLHTLELSNCTSFSFDLEPLAQVVTKSHLQVLKTFSLIDLLGKGCWLRTFE